MFDLTTRQLKDNIVNPCLSLIPTFIQPTTITLLGFFLGLGCCLTIVQGYYLLPIVLWLLNRLFDGLDGSVARQRNSGSEFGGYVDILCDFTVYSLIPIAQCVAHTQQQQQSYTSLTKLSDNPVIQLWLVQSLLQGLYFVNAAGLFMYAAIIEKQKLQKKGEKHLTTVNMPPALVEGTETFAFYTLFLLMPSQILWLYSVFAVGVTITILQRVRGAYYSMR